MRSDVGWRRGLLQFYKAQTGSSSNNSIYVWYDLVGWSAVKAVLRLLLLKYQELLFLFLYFPISVATSNSISILRFVLGSRARCC